MLERNSFDIDMSYGVFSRTDKLHERFQHRNDSFLDGFTPLGHIVYLMFSDVVIPLAWLVQQFLCIGEIEG